MEFQLLDTAAEFGVDLHFGAIPAADFNDAGDIDDLHLAARIRRQGLGEFLGTGVGSAAASIRAKAARSAADMGAVIDQSSRDGKPAFR